MAEEIRLVGVFTDDITPKLKKLSKSINDVAKSFTRIQTKLRPIVKEMGMLAMASERVATALKAQKSAIDSNARSWNNYKKSVGQAASAQRKAFKGAPRGGTPAPRMPRAPRAVPRVRPRDNDRPNVAAAVGGGVFGAGLSNMLTSAIVRGFSAGVQLMAKPFQYFGRAFAERVSDEMADIQSAGGMFAIDNKNKEGERLFKGFSEARQMQEKLNRELAKSAAALPGATNDYVRAARGLTDTVMQAFQSDRESFGKLAEDFGVAAGASSQDQISKVLSKFTEQTVLLGQGGGQTGMPLTILMEQMITKDQVDVKGMKNRFRQLMYNPLLSGALEDAQSAINETAVGSAERIRAVMTALQKALPEEVITAQRMSASGVIESIRSAFVDPDTGLFGLGRELKLAIPKINDYGQYVDANGKVVESASEALKESTTLFKIVREVLGGFMTPLAELAQFLPELFDPLLGIADAFVELRKSSMLVLQKFNAYSNWFKSQKFPDAPQRGALAAFNKLLVSIGAIDKQEALSTAKLLETKGSDLSSIAQKIFKQLFDSDFMKQVGEALGKAVGSVFSAMASVLAGSNDMATAGPFAQGFQSGFNSVKGGEAIKTIIQSIFALLGKAILEIFKAAPFETSLVSGLVLFGPAIAAAIGTAIISAIPRMLSGSMLANAAVGGGGGGIGAAIAGGFATILASPALLAAIVAGLAVTAKVTEDVRNDVVLPGLAQSAQERTNAVRGEDGQLRSLQGNGLAGIMDGLMGELTWVGHDFIKGFGDIFTGLYNIVVGAFSDPTMVTEGINQIFSGLWSLFTMIGHLIIAIGYAVPGLIMGILIALKNLFLGLVGSIASLAVNLYQMADNLVGGAITNFFTSMANAIGNMWNNRPKWLGGNGGEGEQGSPEYDGKRKMMPLNSAIATEQKNKPPGTDLVIANTSEKIIPAYKGYTPPGMSSSSSKMGEIAAYLSDLCDKVDLHGKATTAELTKMAVKLESGINVMIVGEPTVIAKMDIAGLGGGTGGPSMFTGAAAGFGLTMTSGYRPGDDDSYHGLDRARDYAGDPANMKKFASFMAATYGSSLKELIYTPLGYSISNGQTVAPYATSTHYDHVHVAYGMGSGRPAFFKSQREAIAWEKTMAPSNEMVKSVTSHTGETGRGGVDIGGINITVNAETSMDGDAIANLVAGKVLTAVQQATFTELDVT